MNLTRTYKFHKGVNHRRAYYRRLLGTTIAPNLVPWVLKKNIFIRNFWKWHLFRGCKKAKCLFFFPEKCASKNAPMPSLSRIDTALCIIKIPGYKSHGTIDLNWNQKNFNSFWYTDDQKESSLIEEKIMEKFGLKTHLIFHIKSSFHSQNI